MLGIDLERHAHHLFFNQMIHRFFYLLFQARFFGLYSIAGLAGFSLFL
jgi:hypothetical protein